MNTLRLYLSLTKPGVLFGNALTAAAGFLLASRAQPDPALFLALVIGSTLVIAAACVLNNYFDRDIDAVMSRTKTRAVPAGKVSGRNAVIFGILLALVGFAILYQYTSILVVILGLIGFVDYLYFYAMLGKRKSMHGTLIGSISGAIPITAGYVAVTGTIDIGAVIVFLILFFWQMPEFYSIAIYRHDEYKAAGVPVISVVKGIPETRRWIFIYTVLFTISTILLYTFGYVGLTYLIIMGLLDLYWLWLAVQGFSAPDTNSWARKMFRFSLIVLIIFSAVISLTGILP